MLSLDGNDLTGLAFRDRRRWLEELVPAGPHWRVSTVHLDAGGELLEAAREQGLEGVIAKRLHSTYTPGRRSSEWRKVKVRRRQELVVGGWLPGTGSRADRLGALLVRPLRGRSRYAGRVGTGFSEDEPAGSAIAWTSWRPAPAPSSRHHPGRRPARPLGGADDGGRGGVR
ncbi:MAG: hypothetical protein U5R31_06905 [Acidimicrobiia bacterium]|nr:hypothetical protein [Acidimicrobiia bacterium]